MTGRLLFFVTLASFAVAAGCSEGDPSRPRAADPGSEVQPGGPLPGAGGGSSSDGGSTPTDGGSSTADAGVCNEITNTGLLVDRIAVTGDPPVNTGGTIVDGNYDLASVSVYVGLSGVPGPTGVTYKSSLVIQTGTIDQVIVTQSSGPATETRLTQAYTASTTTILTTQTCPSGGLTSQKGFNATDTELVLTDLLTKEVFTFTKR